MHNRRSYFVIASVLMLAAMAFMSSTAYAQITSATLTGTVFDSSGAVVPNANVSLKNEASGDTRRTVSNAEGYFTFGAVPPGNYTVLVESKGFNNWEAKGIVLNSGDKRNISEVKLVPGAATETVSVEAAAAQITPIDSGEKSTLINQHIMSNVAIVGQNAAEFLKIMPGMAMTGGTLNQASYAADDERTGNGPVGNSFSANGGRKAALDITSDGAHIIDPGCNCGQAMNTNTEMTSELKVMTSNFGADEAKGPTVVSAIGKSGGQQFHGEGYLYSRYFLFNANDSINKAAGKNALGVENAPRPETSYYYPGAQIGGPVLFPHSDFNKNHDKLFFFFGVQAYRQNVDYGVFHAVVPTQAMRNGDFTALASNAPAGAVCDANSANAANCYVHNLNGSAITGVPNANGWANGIFTGTPDPTGTGPALVNTYPLDTVDPIYNNGFNFVKAATRYSNMIQYRGRVDYSINDSTKLYVSYNHQNDNAIESLDTLWTGYAQTWASPNTPYPTPLVETTRSEVVTANLTKLFSPTLTNELIFTYTYLNLPNSFADPTKVQRGSLGINYQMYFNHGDNSKIIFPQLTGWGDGISNQLNTGFELNNTVYAKKQLPSVADNLYKVWGTHTTKFGFYWERTWNSQPGNGNVNGTAIFSNWGSNSSGNAYADMLMGQTTQYNELNYNVVPAFRYLSEEFYGQDSWKVSRRLTLDYGVRVSHLGPWVDTTGYGFAAWYPNLYAQDQGGTVNGATFPGVQWNKVNSGTPLSGSGSRMFFYNPRVGFAWDIFGTGKTVLRGGYGMYHFHDEQNVQNGAYGIVRGSFGSPTAWSPTFASLTPLTGSLAAPSGVTALDPKDTEQPRTQNYSFTIAQRMPWKSVLEVAYVGSKSDYLSNYNNNFSQINDLGPTGLFNAATCAAPTADGTAANGTGTTVCGWMPNCDPTLTNGSGASCDHPDGNHGTGYATNQTLYGRPLSGPSNNCFAANNCLGTVKIINHQMYSNYNSLQVTWNKQAGHATFLANYTFSKALGIRGEDGSATGDPTNLRNNYGTLPNDRTNVFNVAYVYELPTMHGGNRLTRGAVNGWQISGIVQYQTGSDLQAAVTSNFNYSAYLPVGATDGTKVLAVPVQASNQNVLGTPDITLMPKVVCNPRSGLQSHQYVNGNCFSGTPTVGQNGTYIFPTLHGPAFFNTDLSIFKNFTWGNSENKKLQFRFSGYNFLNHPIPTFINGDPALNLQFDQSGNLKAPATGVTFGRTDFRTGHRIIQGMVRFTF